MQAIAELRKEQARLVTAIERLLASAASPVPDAASVAMLRWDLVRALADQRARVDHYLCRPILSSSDTLAVRAVWAHRQNQSALQDALMRCISVWPVARLAAEWDGFATAAEASLQPLAEHLVWEERELFVHAERILSRRAA